LVQAYCEACGAMRDIENAKEKILYYGDDDSIYPEASEFTFTVPGTGITGSCPICGSNLYLKIKKE